MRLDRAPTSTGWCVLRNWVFAAPAWSTIRRLMAPSPTQGPWAPTQRPPPLPPQVWDCAYNLQPVFAAIDRRICANLARVQQAFRRQRIGPHHFQGSSGYGHGDLGREALDAVRCRPHT